MTTGIVLKRLSAAKRTNVRLDPPSRYSIGYLQDGNAMNAHRALRAAIERISRLKLAVCHGSKGHPKLASHRALAMMIASLIN